MNGGELAISQREAVFLLQCESGLTERAARRVLAAGLAGEPTRLPAALLYDRDQVLALATSPVVSEEALDSACPDGLFVARRPGKLASGWRFSPWTAAWLQVRIERRGHFPLVTTLGGFVRSGHDILRVFFSGELQLREPGDWYESLAGRRLPTGPGRDWWIRGLDRPRGRLPS